MTSATYLFTSERLGFRNWREDDLDDMAAINADAEVMKFFSSTRSKEQTLEFIRRMQAQFLEKGYCYFAVDRLDNSEFIGFIGISEQNFEADFTPCTDIGWRLKKSEWNQGFATEGAKRCIEFAFQQTALEKLYAVAPKINYPSELVMIKIGMRKVSEFRHSLLANDTRLQHCVLYEITKDEKTS